MKSKSRLPEKRGTLFDKSIRGTRKLPEMDSKSKGFKLNEIDFLLPLKYSHKCTLYITPIQAKQFLWTSKIRSKSGVYNPFT